MAGHAGFDRSEYPGDAIMAWLKANTNLGWCGYYLGGAPSHSGMSWMGKRDSLSTAGWGIAPIYVGEQVIPPGSEHPSAAKGTTDGEQAVELMEKEGFAVGSCVYLDLEDGSLPDPLSDYTRAWVEAVAAGRFQPGVYCSHVIADKVNALAPNLKIWAFKVPTTAAHDSGGPPFRNDDPSGSGFAKAIAWQLDQNASIHPTGIPGGTLKPIDFSSASTTNPGAPAAGSPAPAAPLVG